MQALKVCRKCRKSLPPEEFWRNNSVCKECNKELWAKRTREQKDRYNERAKRFDEFNIGRYLLRIARKRAKEKGLECTIRAADIIAPEFCPVLGVRLVRNRGSWSDNSYSLDRIDSSKGYVPGNVKVISWKANRLKSDLSLEQLENMLKYVRGEL